MRLDQLQTPALLIHLDRVRHNVAVMTAWLEGELRRWRPHVKTCKVPEVLAELLQAGVRRFKVATTRELAVLLAQAREPLDVLVAMAHHGANLQRIAGLARGSGGHRIAVLGESPEHAAAVAAAGLGLFVDLDPGWGRSGIPLGEEARIRAVAAAAGPALRGLHCYEGHVTDDDPRRRMERCTPIYDQLVALAQALPQAPELVTSGTPGFPCALAYPHFAGFDHAVSPGTVVYWDGRSQELGIPGFAPAVEVLARVVSRPSRDRATLDSGSKALDAAAGTPCAVAQGPYELEALVPSEEHLPMRVLQGDGPPAGALVHLVPRHVCPTVNLADEAVLLEGGEPFAVVPVRARGHETLPSA